MYIYFYTFGCKVNQYETELLKQRLSENGHISVNSIDLSDLCVINSCTVTSQSDLKLRQLIHKIRRENPAAKIALLGCYPQAFNDGLGCEIVLGTANKSLLPEYLDKYEKSGENVSEIPISDENGFKEQLLSAGIKTRGIIKIQDGCDLFCSYCIIPYARGRSRSKPLEIIAEEAEALKKAGQKETVLVGINLSDYGKGLDIDLSDAVKTAAEHSVRVRLGSIEPEKFTGEIIDKLSKIPNLCPHFHLALQSGCDKTLREMKRKYDKEKYFTIVSALRSRFPGCAITTDIMVGFPGETEEDFNESLETVKAIGFADAHVFPYSPRKGTKAAQRSDAVPGAVKDRRAKIMAEAVKISGENYSKSLVGSVQSVLFEREKSEDYHQGHAANYQTVRVKKITETLYREMRDVRITKYEGGCLWGEII